MQLKQIYTQLDRLLKMLNLFTKVIIIKALDDNN